MKEKTKIQKALKELVDNMTWKQEWFSEDISEKEMKEVAKLVKIMQNKFDHSRQKNTLVGRFRAKNYQYIKEIDTERENSRYIAKTKNGQTILYARFDEGYQLNPTNPSEYINQYKS